MGNRADNQYKIKKSLFSSQKCEITGLICRNTINTVCNRCNVASEYRNRGKQ